jgi:hypothetical protein
MAFQLRRKSPLAYAGPVAMLFSIGFAGVWSLPAEEPPATTFRAGTLVSGSSCHQSYVGQCLPVVCDLDCRDLVDQFVSSDRMCTAWTATTTGSAAS